MLYLLPKDAGYATEMMYIFEFLYFVRHVNVSF